MRKSSVRTGSDPIYIHNMNTKNYVTNGDGRILIKTPPGYKGKTLIGGRYVARHRYVMEQILGRYLTEDEIVHHKNENITDDSPENLELTNKKNHNTIHKKTGRTYLEIECGFCHKKICREKKNIHKGRSFCSQSCNSKFYHRHRKGSYKHKNSIHGYSLYRKGCRCEICRAANSTRMKNYYLRKKGGLAEWSKAPHC